MKAARVEGVVQVVIMLAIGGAAGAASFTHVHNVAAAHGQGGWLAWADAVVLELMSIASGLEMRRRKRQHKPVAFPATVLVCAVAMSISAQVVEAERSVIGWIAAAVPAVGFLVMVKIALGRADAGRSVDTQTEAEPIRTVSSKESSVPDGAHVLGAVPSMALQVPDEVGVSEERPTPAVARPPGAVNGDGDGPVVTRLVPDPESRSGTAGTGVRDRSAEPRRSDLFDPAEVTDVVHVLAAAAAARDALAAQGRPLTRTALTEQLRRDGHALSNARASLLVKILKAEVTIEDRSA
ncbi:DUF2637 domain-containing protein [Phytohabitans kaempferiae]|uniref:DUF2637 domain-containing protein n=1 Tax=Phytohabitans kaempferiae TaxID=1620943 RepID=A0ABV6MDK6_9ACTN